MKFKFSSILTCMALIFVSCSCSDSPEEEPTLPEVPDSYGYTFKLLFVDFDFQNLLDPEVNPEGLKLQISYDGQTYDIENRKGNSETSPKAYFTEDAIFGKIVEFGEIDLISCPDFKAEIEVSDWYEDRYYVISSCSAQYTLSGELKTFSGRWPITLYDGVFVVSTYNPSN